MMKIILPIDKATTLPALLVEHNLQNVELLYYVNDLEFEGILASEAVNVVNHSTDYLFIVEKTGVITFNYLVSKFKIVCAIIENEVVAKLAKQHNNAKVLIFNSLIITDNLIVKCISEFLKQEFQEGRHLRRLKMLIKDE